MVSTRSSILLIAATCTLVLQGHVDASPCDADNYSKVAAAVQTLHANCASWTAYLASGGVWTCDSTCHDAVINLVDTLPDCTFGGPYGQNYKQVVKEMAEKCDTELSDSADATTTTNSRGTATSSASTQVVSASTLLAVSTIVFTGALEL